MESTVRIRNLSFSLEKGLKSITTAKKGNNTETKVSIGCEHYIGAKSDPNKGGK